MTDLFLYSLLLTPCRTGFYHIHFVRVYGFRSTLFHIHINTTLHHCSERRKWEEKGTIEIFNSWLINRGGWTDFFFFFFFRDQPENLKWCFWSVRAKIRPCFELNEQKHQRGGSSARLFWLMMKRDDVKLRSSLSAPLLSLCLSLTHTIICCQVTVALQSPRCIISSHLWSELSSVSTTEKLCGCHTHPWRSVWHLPRLRIRRPFTNAAFIEVQFSTCFTHFKGLEGEKFTPGYSQHSYMSFINLWCSPGVILLWRAGFYFAALVTFPSTCLVYFCFT